MDWIYIAAFSQAGTWGFGFVWWMYKSQWPAFASPPYSYRWGIPWQIEIFCTVFFPVIFPLLSLLRIAKRQA